MNKTRLSRIATQGSIFNGASSYINTFKVQTSLDGINFATYQKNGKDSVSRQLLILCPIQRDLSVKEFTRVCQLLLYVMLHSSHHRLIGAEELNDLFHTRKKSTKNSLFERNNKKNMCKIITYLMQRNQIPRKGHHYN